MSSDNFIVNHKICSKCSKDITSSGSKFCKGCKPKKEYNRALDKNTSKRYLNRFEAKSSLNNKRALIESKAQELKFYSSRFRLNKYISPLSNNVDTFEFFTLYWEKFKDFDTFSSFVTKSTHISFAYFAFNSYDIQKKPNFQNFIQLRMDKLPVNLPEVRLIFPVPLSRPLHLLSQSAYWDRLMDLYFENLHHYFPCFSIHSFNPIKAGKHLLSAIYYGGFQLLEDKHPDLISYFSEYSKHNIKEATKIFSLQSVQTLNLYSYLLVLIGDYTLSRYCQSHAIRMSYALGLHINVKRLSPIQRYDRLKLFASIFIVQITTYGMCDFTLNQLTEFEDYDIELLEPEYQIPNSYCIFYFDTEDENVVYGISSNTYSKIRYSISRSLWRVNKLSENYIQADFDRLFNGVTEKYLEIIRVYNLLSLEYPNLKSKILSYKLQLLLLYHTASLETYWILKNKARILKPTQISKIISECCMLFDTVYENKEFVQITHAYPYIAGLNIIKVYPISNLSQKVLIREKLREILDFLSTKFCTDKLSYLIIKNEYESIIKSKFKVKPSENQSLKS